MTKKEHIYFDFHVIQTLPPSCVNRDDTGSPKTAIFGGVNRARISSQSQKHAMREMFKELLADEDVGIRTKYMVNLVKNAILEKKPELGEDKAEKLAVSAFKSVGINAKKADNSDLKSDVLFFISDSQIEALANLIIDDEKNATKKDKCREALKAAPSVDIALFGRMVASDASLNYDACSQVAHAISTHSVQTEYDYFTAVDDASPEETKGSGHLGTVEFNSSTMYRYANINVSELAELINGSTAKAVLAFTEAFIRSMPTGHQNSFANRTLPDYVYVTIRRDQPVNMAGAFEKPVTSKDGYTEKSVKKLMEYADKVCAVYAEKPEKEFIVNLNADEGTGAISFKELLCELEQWIKANVTVKE